MQPLLRIPGPFRLATSDELLNAERLGELERCFDRRDWVRHDSFYRCHMADVRGLDEVWLLALRDQVSAALDLPLMPHVTASAQRMEATDGSDRHTDHPAAGFEAARLILQLDAAEGGHFRSFDGENVWVERPPQPNQAVAMELSLRSHHDVTPCGGQRRTVVFHFWHPANPPDAQDRLDTWFNKMSFQVLPKTLDPLMDAAEATMDDELTGRAAAITWSAWKMGFDDLEGTYARALAGEPSQRDRFFTQLVELQNDGFHREAWQGLTVPPLPLFRPWMEWCAGA